MIYRKATLLDCEAVYSLICELEGRELPYEKFHKIYQEQLKSKQYYCLLAEKDNNILAVLNLRFEEQLHHSGCIAEILEFVVSSSYRSQGTGKQVFEKATQIAKAYGCEQIEVACNQRRIDTHRFYLREGMSCSHYKFSKGLSEDSCTAMH